LHKNRYFRRKKGFSKQTRNFFHQKGSSGPVKYKSVVQKELFIDIYLTIFQTRFSNPIFILERRKYSLFVRHLTLFTFLLFLAMHVFASLLISRVSYILFFVFLPHFIHLFIFLLIHVLRTDDFTQVCLMESPNPCLNHQLLIINFFLLLHNSNLQSNLTFRQTESNKV
jgi:hypothetical protein